MPDSLSFSIFVLISDLDKGTAERVNRILEYSSQPYLSVDVVLMPFNENSVNKIKRLYVPKVNIQITEPGWRGFWSGLQISKCDKIIVVDIRQEIPIKEGEILLSILDKGSDVVVGSRFSPEESILQRRASRWHVFQEHLNTYVQSRISRIPVSDVLTGLVALKKDSFLSLKEEKIKSVDFNISHLLRFAHKHGLKFRESGIMWIAR